MPYNSDMLRPGKMRHRLEFVSPGATTDECGGVSLADTSPLCTVWGEVSAIAGRDTLAAQQFSSEVTHVITIRYRDGITARQQIYFNGPGAAPRAFQIVAVISPTERNKTLKILCVEINDSAQEVLPSEIGLR